MSWTTTLVRRVVMANLLIVVAVLLLPGCGGGGSKGGAVVAPPPPPVTTSNPGYFDNIKTLGGADVYADTANTTQLHIADLQAMVNGSQITLVSVTNNLAYYATFTSLSGNNYTADVTIYQNNIPYESTTLSGTLVAGTSLTGTFATTGTGLGKGTFKLDYSLANPLPVAAVSRIVRNGTTVPVNWRNAFSSASGSTMQIYNSGVLQNASPTGVGNFKGCNINGTITPVTNTALYQVSMTLTSCDPTTVLANGNYTGLATSRTASVTDDRLVVTVTNGVYSMNGEFQ